DDGVALDDIGETDRLDGRQLNPGEGPLVPEAVAVTQALELVGDDPPEGDANAGAGDVVLGQATHPEVDVVDVTVELAQLILQLQVAGDLTETGHAGQAVGRSRGVVVRQPVVAAALDVARGQVEAPRAGRAKQEVTQAIHQLGVNLLGVVGGQVLEDEIDAI